ncbi:2OG-Fe(II) oxygenase family protein [Nocardia sp. CA-107356]|uniref:2OG-Fe(II) oxygenase family protein n=1 Tax=Nocardia sp. CA-107356 TaxID=3239972 RepID=UPI003D8AF64E
MSGVAESAVPQWFAELFAHRRWIRRVDPFPHVYARDVFVPEFYLRLTDELARVRRERPEAFGSVAVDYGAVGAQLAELRDGPLALFLSREWHDLIARIAGVATTGDVEGSVHHHPPGSPQGWPHNDLNPAWFKDPAPGLDEVGTVTPEVDLKTGARTPEVFARETVRAVAVLFYFGNPDWRPGDGGETALYAQLGANPVPALTIPPMDNSLLLFECTPRSWHGFIGGNTVARNCVVMWLHRPKEDVVRRWGGNSIAQWH